MKRRTAITISADRNVVTVSVVSTTYDFVGDVSENGTEARPEPQVTANRSLRRAAEVRLVFEAASSE